jgi:hypothetical protein
MAEKKQALPGAAPTGGSWWQRSRNRWLIAGGLALLAYTLAGFLLAPWLVNRYLPRYVEEQLEHQLSLGEVRINPFIFTCEINDFRLGDAGGELLLEFNRLFVDFELESIYRRAWTFAAITLEAPILHLRIDRQGRLNLAQLLAQLPEREEPPPPQLPPPQPAKPVRLLLKSSALSQGEIHFADYSGPVPVRTTFAPVAIGFSEISTLPERSGAYAVTAMLPGGGRLGWQGDVSLVPLASHGTLAIDDFQPAEIWKFFQEDFNLAEPAGVARLRLDYRFAHAAGETELVVAPLDLVLNDLLLREKAGERPLLQLAELAVRDVHFDLARRELRVPAVALRQGRLSAALDQAGQLDWLQLARPAAGNPNPAPPLAAEGAGEQPAPEAVNGTSQPWRLAIEAFRVADFALHYADRSRGAPFLVEVEEAALELSARAEIGAGEPQVRVAELALRLAGISSREEAGAEHPLWALAGARLAGVSFELAERRVEIEALRLEGGRAELVRTAAGTIRQLEVLAAAPENSPAPADPGPAPAAAPAWRLLLDRGELADFSLDYADQGFNPPLAYGLRDLALTVEGIDTAGREPFQLTAQTKVAQGGTVALESAVAQSGEEASGRLMIAGFNLEPLDTLLAEHVLLRLAGGKLALDQGFTYRADPAGPRLQVDGRAGIDDLLLEESSTGERFLAWRELAVAGLDFSLNPDHLLISEVRLQEPEAKIVIFEDGEINLARIVREKADSPDPAAEPVANGEPAAAEPFPLQVERVRLDNGVVDFADLSLVLPFAARIEQFGGTALNISSEPGSRTTLQFRGQVDEYGEARVDGALAPLDPKHFTDLKVVFRNVTLLPMTAYTATFAGRRIASGRLDLDLAYNIADSELLGDHHVILRDFRLGERVESPDALRLPLDLAIALLTDREGKIDVAVPVRGNLDNPEFSYGHVIWQAIRNLLVRIVSAPFRALGALFGSDSPQPDTVFFAPGQVEPPPPEREKLHQVAEVLEQRPQLILTVHGAFAREPDGASIRSLAVRRSLAEQLGMEVAPDKDPGPVAFDQAKTQRALEALAGGSGPVNEFLAAYVEQTGRQARRVNPALAIFGRGSDDLEFYEALFQHLVDNAPLAEQELLDLALARRTAVIRELTEGAGLEPERVVAGAAAEAEARDELVPIGLELGVR